MPAQNCSEEADSGHARQCIQLLSPQRLSHHPYSLQLDVELLLRAGGAADVVQAVARGLLQVAVLNAGLCKAPVGLDPRLAVCGLHPALAALLFLELALCFSPRSRAPIGILVSGIARHEAS